MLNRVRAASSVWHSERASECNFRPGSRLCKRKSPACLYLKIPRKNTRHPPKNASLFSVACFSRSPTSKPGSIRLTLKAVHHLFLVPFVNVIIDGLHEAKDQFEHFISPQTPTSFVTNDDNAAEVRPSALVSHKNIPI